MAKQQEHERDAVATALLCCKLYITLRYAVHNWSEMCIGVLYNSPAAGYGAQAACLTVQHAEQAVPEPT